MIQDDGPLTFALTLKRWFASNGWPQKITQDWAEDAGVQNPNGPWASQMCGAMKAAGYNPKAQFFLALAEFNRFVEQQNTKVIVNSKLRDRLKGAKPLCLDNGQPYKAPDFWSLYAGLIEPPEALQAKAQFTQEDADAWTAAMRESFRQVSLTHMCSRAEAWQMVKDKLCAIGDRHNIFMSPDDFSWTQEMLAGFSDPTPEELIQMGKRWEEVQPMMVVFDELLGKDFTKKTQPVV